MELSHLALPVTRVLPNGVCVHQLQGEDKGVVRLDILFKGGYSVQHKPLQALFTNRMLREGSKAFSGAEISSKLDYYGAWVDIYSSQECNHIILYVLAKHFSPLLPVVEDFVKHPLFPQENLEVVRRNNKSHFLINSRKVEVVAQRCFERALWGKSHSLGRPVEAEDYDAITREDLLQYFNEVYSHRNCTLFLTGTNDAAVIEAITNSFGNEEWGVAADVAIDVPPPMSQPGLCRVKMENTLQSAIKVGAFTLPSSHSDFFYLRFLNVLLGGYFGSRLMSNIREENGYTYDIISEIDAYGKKNAFVVSSQAANEYVEPLLAELYKEIERLRTEEIPAEEVKLVQNYIMGELCREFEGVIAKTEVFVNAWLSGDSFESINHYIDTIKKVTPLKLQSVAQKYLLRENMSEIIVGA